MGASPLLTLSARSMNANQTVLNTIGHNIANANTPGYSRQSAVLETARSQYSGAGFIGKGMQVDTITRSYNRFVVAEAFGSRAQAAMDSSRLLNLQRLEQVFPTGEESLGQAMGNFLNAMTDVASRPADPSARQVVLGRAADVATRFDAAAAQLADIQAGVVSDLRANVVVVNQLTEQIAAVNLNITNAWGSGHTPNDLLDQRDRLIGELSQYLAVSTVEADDGSMGVFIGGGQRLVLGAQSQRLEVQSDPYDTTRAQLVLVESGNKLTLAPSLLAGGSISALLNFQDQDLQDGRNFVGQLATALAMSVNAQQALGLDLSTPPGAGVPMFELGSPRVFAATTNARDPSGAFLSGVDITRVDPGFLQASSYLLKGDPATPGAYLLVRESDGLTRSVADGDVIDGFRINFNPAPPGAFDTYRLEPVATAALGMRRLLEQPQGIAAASPVSAVTARDNQGSASVTSVYAVDPSFNAANLPGTLTFGAVNPDGSIDYTLVGALGTFNSVWRAGQPIGNEAGVALGFELHLSGVPRTGDVIDLETTRFPSQNNGNVKAFLALQGANFVGQRDLGAGVIAAGATLNDAYAAAMGEIGSRVQGAQYLSAVSDRVSVDAQAAVASESGVNLDEEAARLVQYQQAYQASAKLLAVAQAIFDELINIVR